MPAQLRPADCCYSGFGYAVHPAIPNGLAAAEMLLRKRDEKPAILKAQDKGAGQILNIEPEDTQDLAIDYSYFDTHGPPRITRVAALWVHERYAEQGMAPIRARPSLKRRALFGLGEGPNSTLSLSHAGAHGPAPEPARFPGLAPGVPEA